jgi:hypothetical protein
MPKGDDTGIWEDNIKMYIRKVICEGSIRLPNLILTVLKLSIISDGDVGSSLFCWHII